jgi:hypothetical protein
MKILFLVIFLTSCVGGTLREQNEFEEYPLRQATAKEGKKLKTCLLAAYSYQMKKKEKTGEFYRKAKEIPVEEYCDGFQLGQKFFPGGFEIMAQFHEGESSVRWTVNQDKVVEEHYDEDPEDEFGLGF